MTLKRGPTAELATFAAKLRFGDLPPAVVSDTKRIIADTIACALGGSTLPAGRILMQAASNIGAMPAEASVLGQSSKVSAAAAAFANSGLANALDADETLLNSSHHACCTVPPALALAQAQQLSGQELIVAVAVGYEIAARVSQSLTIARVNERGDIERFPNTGLGWAVFGAAAAAGRALGLDPLQFAYALGIAGWSSPISSHLKWDHSAELHMMKNSPHPFMGFSGVTAARLAALGFTAEPAILDGENGYWRLVGSPECDWKTLRDGLGETWWISRAAIKPYATNRLTHHAIGLFSAIFAEEKLKPEEIEGIQVRSFARVASPFLSGNLAPKNPVEAQFSLPFALAARAYGSDLGPDWCRAVNLTNPRLLAFAKKITVTTDPEIQKSMAQDLRDTRRYPRVPSVVTVQARGTSYTKRADYALGDPGTPETRMTEKQLREKFYLYAHETLGAQRTETLWLELQSLDSSEHFGRVVHDLTAA